MSTKVEENQKSRWRLQRDVRAEKIKLLWAEIEKTKEQYFYLGANDSATDRVLQGIVYGLSCDIPVAIPKSPKQYLLCVSNCDDIDEAEQLNRCAQDFHRLLKEMKKEWKSFHRLPLPETLVEFLKEQCWRFHP